jgi:hypothetical protein
MKTHRTARAGGLAGATARYATNPPPRILVINGDIAKLEGWGRKPVVIDADFDYSICTPLSVVEQVLDYICGQCRCGQAPPVKGPSPRGLLGARNREPGSNQLPPCAPISWAQAVQSTGPSRHREEPAAVHSHLGPGQSGNQGVILFWAEGALA